MSFGTCFRLISKRQNGQSAYSQLPYWGLKDPVFVCEHYRFRKLFSGSLRWQFFIRTDL